MKTTVAIIGVGLLGGSLGQALRKTGRYKVLGIARKASTLRKAKRFGALDTGSRNLADVSQADLVVVCTPVDVIVPTIRRIRPYLKPTAVVTDVGSVKGVIHRQVRGVRFVGSHPLAGSHKTGVAFAKPDLFRGATCVMVAQDRSVMAPIRKMWQDAGARVVEMTSEDHDACVALTSHLPHLIAYALVQAARKSPNQKRVTALVAGSFRDVTRVASSDPEQWSQIFQANRPHLRVAARQFQKEFARLVWALRRPSLRSVLKGSQAYRSRLFNEI